MKKVRKPLFTCKLIGEPKLALYPNKHDHKQLASTFVESQRRALINAGLLQKLKEQGVIGA